MTAGLVEADTTVRLARLRTRPTRQAILRQCWAKPHGVGGEMLCARADVAVKRQATEAGLGRLGGGMRLTVP